MPTISRMKTEKRFSHRCHRLSQIFDISTQHPCDSCSNPCSYPLHLHRVNPRNLWETSTHHRIIEHGCQRYHGWRLRRCSPTDTTDYHRFLISARNIRVMLMITAFYCYICFTHHQKACFSFISTTSVIRFIINTLSTCKINLSSLKQHETTKVLLRIVDELILRQRKQITNN